MVILDKMILTGRFTEFVHELLKIRNDEMIDQTRWEFWLHRVFEKSYDEYLSLLDNGTTAEEVPQDGVLEATVRNSLGIINGFCPS